MKNGQKTKKEITAELVAHAVGAGKKTHLESVDFSDPNRPLTCLEVDFPILPINQIAQIEGNAGKPIYQMGKWWARRRSSVFRSMLIAAAAKAPDDLAEAAKLVRDSYYGNHQDNEAFKQLKVADIFMGGGTTLVEGARLGMQMTGNDLNPVAWLVVKNELDNVDLDEVDKLFDHIEKEVKPQIMPFYACEGPNGEKGRWTHLATGRVMGDDFDPWTITPDKRKAYGYEGPEVIYTFWAKHGPCSAPGCDHRTPIMPSPLIAIKTLTVKTWLDRECKDCGGTFDLECHEARIAPDECFIISESEKPFAAMDKVGAYNCPHCKSEFKDSVVAVKGGSSSLPKKITVNKKVSFSLVIGPDWLKGSPGNDAGGILGGTAISSSDSTIRWNNLRNQSLKLYEVRGDLPEIIIDPDTGQGFSTVKGTVPKKAHFTCQESTCGREQNLLDSVKRTKTHGPMSNYAIQCYSPQRELEGYPYRGRFFKSISHKDLERTNRSISEWELRKNGDLKDYWPRSEIPFGFMTSQNNGGLANHGFTHWHTMFNERQLLVHATLLKTISEAKGYSEASKAAVLGTFQQYLRNQCLFSFWHIKADKLASFLSNSNFHSKNNVIESSLFPKLGLGNWESCSRAMKAGLRWRSNPTEIVPKAALESMNQGVGKLITGKSQKVYPQDIVLPVKRILCGSSTELTEVETGSLDMVITDPPFGGLLHYSELSDFFYVWLRLYFKDKYPKCFEGEYTPKTLEAVANRARNPDDSDAFYKRLLTECWRNSYRMLKPGGILAFTFHHSEDEPWVDVLESLFDAGFYLEATYPIRSDETKGQGSQPGTIGSQKIEYDIIHVCRKRTNESQKISWARLRRRILADVKQLQTLLEHHQEEGLPVADIEVIKRGKALEYFSKHYGQVYLEEGREFTLKDALVGINQIIEGQFQSDGSSAPVICEPISRQFLRIFGGKLVVPRDQMQKFLRGSGIAPSDFIGRGWTEEKKKVFYWVSPLDIAKEALRSKRPVSLDLDQAMLLVGACYADSGINARGLLDEKFKPHPALGQLLDWLQHNGADKTMRHASMTARQLYTRWESDHQAVLKQQMALFGMEQEL